MREKVTQCQHPGCPKPRTPGSPALCAEHKSERKKAAYRSKKARVPSPGQMTTIAPRVVVGPEAVERPAPVGVVRGRFARVAMGVSGLCPP
jgi:hypothetical protein